MSNSEDNVLMDEAESIASEAESIASEAESIASEAEEDLEDCLRITFSESDKSYKKYNNLIEEHTKKAQVARFFLLIIILILSGIVSYFLYLGSNFVDDKSDKLNSIIEKGLLSSKSYDMQEILPKCPNNQTLGCSESNGVGSVECGTENNKKPAFCEGGRIAICFDGDVMCQHLDKVTNSTQSKSIRSNTLSDLSTYITYNHRTSIYILMSILALMFILIWVLKSVIQYLLDFINYADKASANITERLASSLRETEKASDNIKYLENKAIKLREKSNEKVGKSNRLRRISDENKKNLDANNENSRVTHVNPAN